MNEPTNYFEDREFDSIIESAKLAGMLIFFRKFIPLLLDERFEISIFLDALCFYIEERNFSTQIVELLQQSCAEARRIEKGLENPSRK